MTSSDVNYREVALCLAFISECVQPYRREHKTSSYGLKHQVEIYNKAGGIPAYYVSNDSFKEAMSQCGYKPIDPTAVNHTYKIKVLNRYKTYPLTVPSKWI